MVSECTLKKLCLNYVVTICLLNAQVVYTVLQHPFVLGVDLPKLCPIIYMTNNNEESESKGCFLLRDYPDVQLYTNNTRCKAHCITTVYNPMSTSWDNWVVTGTLHLSNQALGRGLGMT